MQGSVEQKRESILGITIEFGGGASITIFFLLITTFLVFVNYIVLKRENVISV